jgi:hypothetical protein
MEGESAVELEVVGGGSSGPVVEVTLAVGEGVEGGCGEGSRGVDGVGKGVGDSATVVFG